MTKALLCGGVLLLLTGCSGTSRTHYYSLAPTVPPASSAQYVPSLPTLAIAAVTLPELVDRPQLVLQESGTQVAVLDSRRWAEPLKTAIPRVLAENLYRSLGSRPVAFSGQHAATVAEYRIFVDIQRFETTAGTVQIDALWTIRRTGAAQPLLRQSRLQEPVTGEGYDQLTAAYSRALGALAKDIATAIAPL